MIRHSRSVLFWICLVAACVRADRAWPQTAAPKPQPQTVDEAKAKAAGLRKLTSQHLVLYTDLPSDPEVDRLPELFDQAVPQWAAYFGIDEAKTKDWQAQAFLIRDRKPFEDLKLLPEKNTDFANGISSGREIWLHEQATPYYRRHLLLHEGTHAFMTSMLGSCGPGWYMEGTAELMATHRVDPNTGQLTLRTMPTSRQEVPMLGRIKLIRDARDKNRALDLAAIMKFDNTKQLDNEAYAWCWAVAKLLDTHPRYRERFQSLRDHVRDAKFDELFQKSYAKDWADLNAEWQAFVATVDHAYDFDRMAIAFEPGQPLGADTKTVTIDSDRGWQSTGIQLESGKRYRITATGRYEIARDAQTWRCEPGGVTIEYYDGHPLGMLLGAIDGRTDKATLANILPIGLGTTIKPAASGTLYLRVNDSAGRLNDNRGTLSVTIAEAK